MEYLSGSERAIDAADVRRLYDGAGWWPGWKAKDIARAVSSSICVGAWDGERLIGFTRALSDRVHRAYIEDVVIDPEFRGRGIGEAMVAQLVEEIGTVHIVSLFCEPERVGFYSRNGFEPSESQVMMHRETKGRGSPGALDITVE